MLKKPCEVRDICLAPTGFNYDWGYFICLVASYVKLTGKNY